jgi:hypothetical protein
MSEKETGKKQRPTRNRNRTSPSQGTLKSKASVSHLDGLSEIHFEDVASNRRQLSPEEVKVDLAEAALFEAYYKGTGPRPQLVTNIWFGDCGVGQKAPDGHDGSAVVLPGAEWQTLIGRADTSRREWRDTGGKKRRSDETKEMSGKLRKIFARLPPWVAVEAGTEIDRASVVAAAEEVAKEFQKETGRRVLAANIHVESSHDIHVHLIHTNLIPEEKAKRKYTGDYVTKVLARQRKQVKAELTALSAIKPTRAEIQEELERQWESGRLENPNDDKTCYLQLPRPEGARRHLTSMNQPYCSKTTLWEADGRSERVASVNEQYGHHFTFDAVVREAAKRAVPTNGQPAGPENPTGPENIYIDYWLAKRWTHAISSRLSPESQNRAKESAVDYIERYVRDGSSLPNPALDAAREKAGAEIAAREEQLTKAEEEVKRITESFESRNQQLIQGQDALKLQVTEHECSKMEIEKERAALRRIPLDELCAKLGFVTDTLKSLRLNIVDGKETLSYRVLREGPKFRLEYTDEEKRKWCKVAEGKGAIDLIMAIPPKISFKEACEKLASLFPDYLSGLQLEILEREIPSLGKIAAQPMLEPTNEPKASEPGRGL